MFKMLILFLYFKFIYFISELTSHLFIDSLYIIDTLFTESLYILLIILP